MKYQEVPTEKKQAVKDRLIESLVGESLKRFQYTIEKNTWYDGMSTTRLSFEELPTYWSPSLMPQLEQFLENIPEDSPLRGIPLEREAFKTKMGELIAQFKKECEEYCDSEDFLITTSEEMLNNIQFSADGSIWLGGNAYPVWQVLYKWFGWWFFQPIRSSQNIDEATFVSKEDWEEEMGDIPMTWKTVNEYCASKGGKLVHRQEVVNSVRNGEIILSEPEWTEGGLRPCILSTEDSFRIRNAFGSLSGGKCFRYM